MKIGGAKMFNKLLMILMIFGFLASDAKSQSRPTKCDSTETVYDLPCLKQELDLVGTKILIKVYTKPKSTKIIDRTFVVVHNNEEKGLDAAKKVISEHYGRLVEVVSNFSGTSNNPDDNKRRLLYFGANKEFCIDPNRIYTKVGIGKNLSDCESIPNTKIGEIFEFGQKLIKIVTNNSTHKFIIGVHNNGNTNLSLDSWSGNGSEAKNAVGIFKANNHSTENIVETGNFILVSNIALFVKFSSLEEPFNIALQENRRFLVDSRGENKGKIKTRLDDGSMSIYFGATLYRNTGKSFDYINIEAEGKKDQDDDYKKRQMKAIELVITKIKL